MGIACITPQLFSSRTNFTPPARYSIPPNMPVDYESSCAEWSNETIIRKEISNRRSIASYITSLALTGGVTVASAGTLAPLTLFIGAFKLYKINSYRSKLKIVRAELARRHLSPADQQKRDVLVPLAITCTVYALTLGFADIIDIVPSDVQVVLDGHVECTAAVEQGVSRHYTSRSSYYVY